MADKGEADAFAVKAFSRRHASDLECCSAGGSEVQELVKHARVRHGPLLDAMEPFLRDLAAAAVTIWEQWWQILNEIQASFAAAPSVDQPWCLQVARAEGF